MGRGSIILNRYQLEKLLSRSGFFDIWLALDLIADIDVVVKILTFDTIVDQKELSLLRASFPWIIQKHENLVYPLFIDVNEKELVVVLPYYEQGNLLNRIGKFTENDVWHCLYDIAKGLDDLHHMEPPVFMYPFLMPDDILISDNGLFLINGWYMAAGFKHTLLNLLNRKFVAELSTYYEFGGNLTYIAPERLFNASPSHLDLSKCDIYSLGCIAFEMLTGNPPFGERGGLMQIEGGEIPDLPNVRSKRLKKVIFNCLSYNPDNRPTAKQLMDYANDVLKEKDNLLVKIWKRIICLKTDIS